MKQTQTDGLTGEKLASTVKEASEMQSQGPMGQMDLPETEVGMID